jgi:hypothetical protein
MNIHYDFKEGTQATNNIPDRFEDLPRHDIDVFQSECIQNIYDARSASARDKKLPVEVEFIVDHMGNDEVAEFREMVGKDFFNKIRTSYEKSGSYDVKDMMTKVIDTIDNSNNWLALRIIEKNTTGLNGYEDPDRSEDQRSKFDALMRAVNKSEKDEAIAGGTFGKGSSVYTFSSGIWMWFAYSMLEDPFVPNQDDAPEPITHARFMGRGLIAPYTDRGDQKKTYLGHRWFCRDKNALPFINSAAHEYAKKLRLPLRDINDHGTSYIIPAFFPDEDFENTVENVLNKFKQDIIKKWFIPIYNGELVCRLSSMETDYEAVIIDSEYILNEVPQLKHKIEILDWYKNDCRPRKAKLKKIPIKIGLPAIGDIWRNDFPYAAKVSEGTCHLVIKELDETESEFAGFNSYNRVALTRNAGMIINHYPYLSDETDADENSFNSFMGKKRFESILFAGKMSAGGNPQSIHLHTDLFLSFAENPAHNMWLDSERDLGRCRLKRFEKNPMPYPWNRISKLYRHIENEIKKAFPKEDTIPVKKDICNFWKKIAHLQRVGESTSAERTYHFTVLEEGFINGRYSWTIRIDSNCENTIELSFENYLKSMEAGKEKDFKAVGVEEFSEIQVTSLEIFDNFIVHPGESKTITINTCDIKSNSVFKNLQPVVEIKDTIIDDDTKI